MSKSVAIALMVMAWINILVIVEGIFYVKQRDDHIRIMGADCVKHIHNLSASANANLQDVYSFNTLKDAENYEWSATAQCMIKYPLYSTNNSSTYNLSLN